MLIEAAATLELSIGLRGRPIACLPSDALRPVLLSSPRERAHLAALARPCSRRRDAMHELQSLGVKAELCDFGEAQISRHNGLASGLPRDLTPSPDRP
jgi:hypothetical protein